MIDLCSPNNKCIINLGQKLKKNVSQDVITYYLFKFGKICLRAIYKLNTILL